jgi:membrane protein YdbS with pleckstrin-like domain
VIESETWNTLPPRARLLFHLQALVRWVFAWLPFAGMVGTALLYWSLPAAGIAASGLAFLGFLQAVWLPSLAFERAAWLLAQDALRIRGGVWVHAEVAIPRTRVQHVDVRQGPIERWLGLAHLQVHTASGLGADGSLPGLELAVAEDLRRDLVARVADDGV